jgi:predicted dehydrogenase
MSSTTLRAGVIGATGRGNYGHGLGETFTALERTRVVAVADADAAGGAEAQQRMDAARHYLDYREMLDREQLDLVAVTPRWTDQRRAMVVAAAEAGVKGIYCEKPFAATLADADAMLEACDRHGVRMVVAHRRGAVPELRVKELVDAGEIGDIQVMRGHGKGDHRAGSLDLMILGTHILDGIRYVADSNVAWAHGHVTQDGRALTRDDIREGDEGVGLLAGNRVAAYYVFENGLTAHYESFQGYPEDANDHNRHLGFEVYGTKGIVSIRNSPAGELYLHRHDLWVPDTDTRRWERIRFPEWEQSNVTVASNSLIVEELLAAIDEDREIRRVSSGHDARAALEMIMAVHESNRLGTRVAFPLANRDNPYATWQAAGQA